MFSKMVAAAPHTPTTIESMRNYAKGASIATQLAAFIANLGYSATANHLRHYDALLVPLAVDAGLGELGRIGYLVTKELGPRVRLGAVTTGLPLIPDKPVDIGIEAFCRVCNKCAICCPSGSIPSGDQAEVNGTLRWKLNEETCFAFWGKIGTDCNVCMRVCPWSHARTFPHKIIVELVSRNVIAGRLFTVMDDVFYGKRPRPKAPPGWAKFDGEGR
jgi:reductive dehalogenase